MKGARFDWSPAPLRASRNLSVTRILESRLQMRIHADREFGGPLEDHTPDVWPPAGPLAPLADLAVDPATDHVPGRATGSAVLFVMGPAGGRPGEQLLARGTRLRPIAHHDDRNHDGLDLDSYEILDGPDVGTILAVGCGGRWGRATSVANLLIACADEPILANPDAGARLLGDLRGITDDVAANLAGGGPRLSGVTGVVRSPGSR